MAKEFAVQCRIVNAESGSVLVTFLFTSASSRFGTWNFHAGADGFAFGDTTRAFNAGKDGVPRKGAVTGTFGVGVSY
jgi:hypothetical protein